MEVDEGLKQSLTGYRWPGWWRVSVLIASVVGLLSDFLFLLVGTEVKQEIDELLMQSQVFRFALVAFFAGLVVADIADKKSWFRHNLRHFRRVGDFKPVSYERDFRSLGDDLGGKLQYISVLIPLVVHAKCTLDVLRYRVTLRDLFERPNEFPKKYDLKLFEGRKLLAGEVLDVPVAFMPMSPGNPGCLVKFDKEMYVIGQRRRLSIDIELVSSWRRSAICLEMIVPTADAGFDPFTQQYFGPRFRIEAASGSR